MRKILNNYKKQKRVNGVKEERLETPLRIQDKNGCEIKVGDILEFCPGNKSWCGVVLYHRLYKKYGIFWGRYYGIKPYDYDSYAYWIPLHLDNGARMHLRVVKSV